MDLPIELIDIILKKCDLNSLIELRSVNKDLCNIAYDHLIKRTTQTIKYLQNYENTNYLKRIVDEDDNLIDRFLVIKIHENAKDKFLQYIRLRNLSTEDLYKCFYQTQLCGLDTSICFHISVDFYEDLFDEKEYMTSKFLSSLLYPPIYERVESFYNDAVWTLKELNAMFCNNIDPYRIFNDQLYNLVTKEEYRKLVLNIFLTDNNLETITRMIDNNEQFDLSKTVDTLLETLRIKKSEHEEEDHYMEQYY